MQQASVDARRAPSRVGHDPRRAFTRIEGLRARAVDGLRAVHLRLPRRRRLHISLARPSLGHLTADRRLAPVLVLLIVLGAVVATTVPSATAAVGSTGSGDSVYQPSIAGLRADGAAPASDLGDVGDPASAAVAAPPYTRLGEDLGDGLPPAGDYALDGTLVKPLTASAVAASFELGVYSVKAGDTLSGIAARYGLRMMTLWWANKLNAKDELHVGQRLLIPPEDGIVYTVKEGDTLGALAARYHADVDSIVSYNQLATDELTAGQALMIPDGVGANIAVKKAPTALRPVARSSGRVASGCVGCRFSGRMTWPVPGGYISQYFSYWHPALDIANDYGSPIVAAASGRVINAGWVSGGGGLAVYISDGNNIYTTYNHMSSVAVYVGQYVARGQFIGRVGTSGAATGPHCHFEVWIGPIWAGGYRVNPLNYL